MYSGLNMLRIKNKKSNNFYRKFKIKIMSKI